MLDERANMAAVDPSGGGCKAAGLVRRETHLTRAFVVHSDMMRLENETFVGVVVRGVRS